MENMKSNFMSLLENISDNVRKITVTAPPPVIQLPPFKNGSDPIEWLARADTLFEFHNTPEDRKVLLAMVAMEGHALHWLRFLRKRKPDFTWPEFSQALLVKFEEGYTGNPYGSLIAVEQTGTVDEYINRFVRIANLVPELNDEHFLGIFMHGLRENIRCRVRMISRDDVTVTKAMRMARNVEATLVFQNAFCEEAAAAEDKGATS